ncbi:MAG: hypothetical protein KIT27_03370 [Legionellales bacterium]|nr:hypothetical protein [Legionellales bacterium]
MAENRDYLPELLLQMEIAHPDYEDVWFEGYDQGQRGISEASNPYKKQSREYHYWQEGWWAGFFNEPSVFAAPVEETIQSGVVGDVKVRCANDNEMQPTYRLNAGKTLFTCLCAVFVTVAAYTLYDMAA